MQINFQNNYPYTVWVAIAVLNTTCEGQWDPQGWWSIDPGNSAYVADTCNEFLYFYAEAADGAYWAGPYAFTVDPYNAFEFCNIGNTNEITVGMRQIDDGVGGICWPWDSTTVTLTA